MNLRKTLKGVFIISLFSTLLNGCGGGSNNSAPVEPPTSPATKTAFLVMKLPQPIPLIGVPYSTTSQRSNSKTQSNGEFYYKKGETVTFKLAGQQYTLRPSDNNSEYELAIPNADSDTQQNLKLILLNLDKDNNKGNGINLEGVNASINPRHSTQKVNQALYKKTGKMPRLLFSPTLGINTEAPQGEADLVGQAMPFVDIFRTARPFAELSGKVKLDKNGWPTELDPDLAYARTKLLQGTLKDAIPSGKYTLFYEGSGQIQIGGAHGLISNTKNLKDQQGLSFDLDLQDAENNAEANAISLIIKNIAPGEGNYIKNIRLIMPGGSCRANNGEYNPFIRVNSQSDCPQNTEYVSFASRYEGAESRNKIIFNPDYLSFLRHFKVVRMMNLMEASHGVSSCAVYNNGVSEIDKDCVKEPLRWSHRANLNDAVWGGSARTSHTKRNGVPVEVVVALANTLNRDMWVNMPHSADDKYITQFARYVSQNLHSPLKIYLEYANETWNPGFIGHFYVEQKGIEAGLNTVPDEFQGYRDEDYFARLRYYSSRAVEIFDIWKSEFNDNLNRVVRVLGTSQGDTVLTEQMIKYVGSDSLDAIAMAPYFFGCAQQTNSCIDAPKVLANATHVDDIFDIINQDKSVDPSALDSTINKIAKQVAITSRNNLQLLSYEGGQHLTTSVMGSLGLNETEKAEFRELFKQANRDPRIGESYQTLLKAWESFKDDGATLFTLYTLPQSYYRFGNWGLKEHLNKSRASSPKYDAVMRFQEETGVF